MRRIHLISGPRNISTALMYAFAQRADTKVVDEPFYGWYLAHTGLAHPGREEIMASMLTEPGQIIDQVIYGAYEAEVVFFKNMAKHLIGFDTRFCEQLQNVFLIRDPARLITSFAKVVPAVTEAEIGLKQASDLFRELKQKGHQPLVLNSEEVLKNPPLVLAKLCRAMEIPFDDHMLHWAPGPRPEDGIWARHWYANVHASKGFQAYEASAAEVPEKYKSLLAEVQPHFEYLNQFSIKSA